MTIRTDTKRKRFDGEILAFSLAAAALFGMASQAGAQTTTTTETTRTQLTATVPDQCTNESVNVAFDETHKSQTQTGPNFTRISDTFHDQGTGTGAASAAQYQFSSMSTNTFRASSQNFYARILIRDHLIRQGSAVPGDDLFVLQTILLNVTNGHGTFKVQNVQGECR